MELTALISPIVSALVAVFGAYTATKRAAEDREREQERRMAEFRISVSSDLAALSTKVDALSKSVEKHNGLNDRMTAAETEINNIYHRIDDLKGVKL